MEKRNYRKLKPHITSEQEKNLERDRAAMKRERIRIALCMITHNEPDEKIRLYTRFTSEELQELREILSERQSTERERKSEAMRRGLSYRDSQFEVEDVREAEAVLEDMAKTESEQKSRAMITRIGECYWLRGSKSERKRMAKRNEKVEIPHDRKIYLLQMLGFDSGARADQ